MKTAEPAALSAALVDVRERLAASRVALGHAVVADRGTKDLHREVADLERREAELAAALPVAEQQVQAAAVAAKQARIAEVARLDAERATARLAAAKRVDAALKALGEAHADFLAVPLPSDASVQWMPRAEAALRGAVQHFAPDVARAMKAPVAPHPMRKPMAEVL